MRLLGAALDKEESGSNAPSNQCNLSDAAGGVLRTRKNVEYFSIILMFICMKGLE